ncbi:unnamed protein product [Lymnaea stagnalis]|uniref:Lipase domain-containing protein n=1 Tax=Lymnaea stagnalis TaxID=6523 RepID=A0AAV2IHY2_LYMST
MRTKEVSLFLFIVSSLILTGPCVCWLLPQWWTQCYTNPPIGCFPTSYPYNNTAGLGPQSPQIIRPQFHFYGNSDHATVTLDQLHQVRDNVFNPAVKTVVIIHGYLENTNTEWIEQMATAILQKGDVNVVVVDWSRGANNLIYYQSAANTRVVGAVLALLLQELVSMGSEPGLVHLIGFSLGAHVAGYAGGQVNGIGRITGLDPAGPSFEGTPPETRLDPTDAIFVDVIHTDGAPGIGMGTLEPMGTVDFYPNGGMHQPACPNRVVDRLSAMFETLGLSRGLRGASVQTAVACSHMRATHIFTYSINNNCTLPTRRCPSHERLAREECESCDYNRCPVIGYNLLPENVRDSIAVYRTDVHGESPYCCKKSRDLS